MKTLLLVTLYLLGAAAVLAGLALIYVPLAFVACGAFLLRAALVLDQTIEPEEAT